MKKNNLVKLLFAASFFVIAILLVVGAVVENFEFGIVDGIVYFAGACAVVCLIACALLENKQGTLLASFVFSLICFFTAIALGLDWYWSIVISLLYLAFLIVFKVVFLHQKVWDRGNNQRDGYKDYQTKKTETEAAETEKPAPAEPELNAEDVKWKTPGRRSDDDKKE